jgi:hypothetical protein
MVTPVAKLPRALRNSRESKAIHRLCWASIIDAFWHPSGIGGDVSRFVPEAPSAMDLRAAERRLPWQR